MTEPTWKAIHADLTRLEDSLESAVAVTGNDLLRRGARDVSRLRAEAAKAPPNGLANREFVKEVAAMAERFAPLLDQEVGRN